MSIWVMILTYCDYLYIHLCFISIYSCISSLHTPTHRVQTCHADGNKGKVHYRRSHLQIFSSPLHFRTRHRRRIVPSRHSISWPAVGRFSDEIRRVADEIAQVDLIPPLHFLALKYSYTRPVLTGKEQSILKLWMEGIRFLINCLIHSKMIMNASDISRPIHLV